MTRQWLLITGVVLARTLLASADTADVQALLNKEIIGPRQSLLDATELIDSRVPRMPDLKTAEEWQRHADKLRAAVLENVVFRGEAAKWREGKTKVEWLETIDGGPGYRIKKLRYEAVPGLWIPALLYEPEKLAGKVPAHLAVNGHDGNGKAADYKQTRCINLAKRGMLVLNLEWLGMGQLRGPGFSHTKMNQLDLCGTSGLAPFYLAMQRGLDVLLDHPHADPERVAVSGLSGGGWQTIFISSLDPRVKLSNPVAGYSSFRTRIKHHKDLGDSEQTPCDLATVADYTHLTALMAPRPTLLTYNSKDECCFESGYALPPLTQAAGPVFKLFGKEAALRTHVNDDPGTHNFLKDNRQVFYRMVGDHFFPGDKSYSAEEMACEKEIKSKEALAVDLPMKNADFNTLAVALSQSLPRDGELPTDKAAAERWQKERRAKLREIVRATNYEVKATNVGTEEKAGTQATYWKLKLSDAWTVPVAELVRGTPKGTVLLVADAGRKGVAAEAERLLATGQRVLAVDPFYFGESKVEHKDWLFALTLATVGERPLGIQAGQVAALARWSMSIHGDAPVTLLAIGPRSTTFALVAAGFEEKAIGRVEIHNPLGSLKELIEQNRGVDQMPEQFCFGLLEAFDTKHLVALCAPRTVTIRNASDRTKTEFAGLNAWYKLYGTDFDPLR